MIPLLLLMLSVPSADDKAKYWESREALSEVRGAFQASLTDQQKQIWSQIEAYAKALDAAEKKACPSGIDQAELKKRNLVCLDKKDGETPKNPASGAK